MTSLIFSHGAPAGIAALTTGFGGTVNESPPYQNVPLTSTPTLSITGIDLWITACCPPKNSNVHAPTVSFAPSATVVTFQFEAAAATPAGPKMGASGLFSRIRASWSSD